MTNQKRFITIASLCLLIVVAIISAANDPGHDTLYIEEQGNSTLNGTLTINYNLSIVNTTFQGAGLNLYGNGYNSAPTQSYVSGTNAGDMYIDTASNLYLKYNGGSKVYIGFLARTDLNVSGALYVEGLNYSAGLVCLANGSNCPASLGGANISGNGASAGYLAQWQNASILNNSIIYQNGTNIGIGTSIPLAQLHLNSTSNQLRISYDDTNYGNISVDSAGNMTIKATGHVIIDLS